MNLLIVDAYAGQGWRFEDVNGATNKCYLRKKRRKEGSCTGKCSQAIVTIPDGPKHDLRLSASFKTNWALGPSNWILSSNWPVNHRDDFGEIHGACAAKPLFVATALAMAVLAWIVVLIFGDVGLRSGRRYTRQC